MADAAKRRVLARRPECELVEIGLADQNRAGASKLRDDRRIRGGHVSFAHARGCRRRHARNVDQVLDRDGDAVQRSAVAPRRQLAIRRRGIAASVIAHHADERIEPRLELGDALKTLLGEVARRHLTRANTSAEFFDSHTQTKRAHRLRTDAPDTKPRRLRRNEVIERLRVLSI